MSAVVTPTITPATPAAPVTSTPAPTGNAVVIDSTPSPSLAAVKAARRTQAATTTTATPAGDTAGTDGNATDANTDTNTDPKPDTAKIDMDAAALSQFTQLNKDLRATRTKLKETEDKIASFSKFERAQALAKEGKHYDAAREAGIDVDAALQELLGNTAQTTEQTELAKVKQEIDDLRRERENERTTKTEEAKREEAAAVERGKVRVVEYVTKNAEKYAHLAKAPELVHAALADADAVYDKIKANLGDGEDLSSEDKNQLLFDALDVHEEKWAKTFGAGKPIAGFDSSLRGNVSQTATAQPKYLTFDQVKAARRAAKARR